MFIEVLKISQKKKKTTDGSDVRNPLGKGERLTDTSNFRIDSETIRVDEIKSIRRYHKDMDMEAYIEGNVTLIYLKGDGRRENNPEMLINEDYDSFTQRLNVVKVEHGQEAIKS